MGVEDGATMVASSPRGRSTQAPRLLPSPSMRRTEIIWNLRESSRHDAVTDLIQSIIAKNRNQDDGGDAFYVLDLGALTRLYSRWTSSLPDIKAYYAVKCNPNPLMLRAMNALGANYDCASKAEIEAIVGLGVDPSRIVFANPCKPVSHIRYAAKVGVNLTTYDAVEEVEKIKMWHPECSLLLRIKAPEDEGARIPLGPKYGALPHEVVPLLKAAKEAGLPVIGVSFHVGSGMEHANPYRLAIKGAREAFDAAEELGLPPMHVLDIGGGFTAGGDYFEQAAVVIRASIAEYFHGKHLSSVFGEPGRFFAETPFTLATAIIGKRMRADREASDSSGADTMKREYWLNDGIYGSMNCIIFDFKTVEPTPLACASDPVADPTCKFNNKNTYPSTVFGPTCDSLDKVLTDYPLPDLETGDWLVFSNMGAYTTSSGSCFNGFAISDIKTHLAFSSSDVSAAAIATQC